MSRSVRSRRPGVYGDFEQVVVICPGGEIGAVSDLFFGNCFSRRARLTSFVRHVFKTSEARDADVIQHSTMESGKCPVRLCETSRLVTPGKNHHVGKNPDMQRRLLGSQSESGSWRKRGRLRRRRQHGGRWRRDKRIALAVPWRRGCRRGAQTFDFRLRRLG